MMIKYLSQKILRILTSIPFSLLIILLPILLQVSSAQDSPYVATFNQVWQEVHENFFDPKFNEVDWQSMRGKYEPQVKQAQSRGELALVINQMLSELNTSHTHFYTPDEPAYYQLLGIFYPRSTDLKNQLKSSLPNGKIEYSDIGIFTKDINGKSIVRAILEGTPAAKAGLLIGDEILSVDGRPFQPIQSFAGKAGQEVKLLIQRTPNLNSQQEIAVTPKMFDAVTMFLDAMKASTQVIEREGKKIGYIHIWSYAGDQYQEQLEEDLIYGRLLDADVFVLDLRDGWGGAPLNALNIYTAQNLSVTNIPRNGRPYVSHSAWKKPVVMLVNEGSRSAKEILAFGFQQYDIGPVVGTKTAGAVVAGSPFLMPDGNLLYMAVADVYVNGDKRLEGEGVTPDITVPFSLEYAQGVDPQKERALEIALQAVQESKKLAP